MIVSVGGFETGHTAGFTERFLVEPVAVGIEFEIGEFRRKRDFEFFAEILSFFPGGDFDF